MRIVLIGGSYLPEVNGGVINVQCRLQLLSEWGHKVLVVVPDYELLSKNGGKYHDYKQHIGEVLPNVEVIPFPSTTAMMEVTLLAKEYSFDSVIDRIVAFKPDIVDVESPERLFIGFRQCIWHVTNVLGGKVPAVAVHHANYYDMVLGLKAKMPGLLLAAPLQVMSSLYRHVYGRGFDLVLIHSEAARARLADFGVTSIKQSPFLGIDTGRFTTSVKGATEPADAISALQHGVKFVYLGRKSDEKDLPVLMAAFDQAEKDSRAPLSLLLVGGGEPVLIERIEAWAKGRKNIGLVDMVPHSEAPRYFALADVFVQPSPVETAGLTVLEAMACGKPVLGADLGGVGETITPQTGLVFKSGDSQDCAQQIVKLANDRALRERMGKAAVELASQHSVAEGTKRMVDMWEDLVKERQAHPKPAPSALANGVTWLSYISICFLALFVFPLQTLSQYQDVTWISSLLCLTSITVGLAMFRPFISSQRCLCNNVWTHAILASQLSGMHYFGNVLFWLLGAVGARRKMSYEK